MQDLNVLQLPLVNVSLTSDFKLPVKSEKRKKKIGTSNHKLLLFSLVSALFKLWPEYEVTIHSVHQAFPEWEIEISSVLSARHPELIQWVTKVPFIFSTFIHLESLKWHPCTKNESSANFLIKTWCPKNDGYSQFSEALPSFIWANRH